MSRDERPGRLTEGDEAKLRLRGAIARSRAVLSQYRARLLLLRSSFERPAADVPGGGRSRLSAKSFPHKPNRPKPAES